MEILLVQQSYMMLHPTWSVTGYFFLFFYIFLHFQSEWTWVIMILSGRRIERKTLAYS